MILQASNSFIRIQYRYPVIIIPHELFQSLEELTDGLAGQQQLLARVEGNRDPKAGPVEVLPLTRRPQVGVRAGPLAGQHTHPPLRQRRILGIRQSPVRSHPEEVATAGSGHL